MGCIIGLSLLLCLIAFLVSNWFLIIFAAEIMGENRLSSGSWPLSHQVFPRLIFVFFFGIIPFLYLFVIKYCKISSTKNQLLTLLIISTSGFIFCGMRVIYLKYKIAHINDLLRRAEFTSDGDIPSVRFEDMHLASYLLAGLLVGSLLSLIIFRKYTNR